MSAPPQISVTPATPGVPLFPADAIRGSDDAQEKIEVGHARPVSPWTKSTNEAEKTHKEITAVLKMVSTARVC